MNSGLKGKFLAKAAVIFLVFFVIGIAVHGVLVWNEPSAVIKLNYSLANSGENPNGTRFSSRDILSDEVLTAVKKDMGLHMSNSELASCFYVGSSYDNTPVNTEEPKVATQYRLVITRNASRKLINGRKLLKCTLKEYRKYFEGNLSKNDKALSVDFSDMNDLDYSEVADFIEMNTSRMQGFLGDYAWKKAGYHTKDGETFASLSAEIDDFNNVELENYRSFIQEKGISKDPVEMKSTAAVKKIDLGNAYHRQMARYDVNCDAIKMYANEMATVVLVPTDDKTNQFYMSRTKIGVDYFASDAAAALSQAKLKDEQLKENERTASVSGGSAEDRKQADRMIEEMKKDIKGYQKEGRELFAAYKNSEEVNKLVIEKAPSAGYIDFGAGFKTGAFAALAYMAIVILLTNKESITKILVSELEKLKKKGGSIGDTN